MKVRLSTSSALGAVILRHNIIRAINGEYERIEIETWSYKRSSDNYDIIFHDPDQYVNNPEKNVIFRVITDGNDVVFVPAWWKNNPQPSEEMICLHVGRLVEMLTRYFSKEFSVCTIVKD